jgi:glycerate kinase
MTQVVIALDSFKGSIAAAHAAEAFAEGWRRVEPAAELVLRPMADGGEGTLDAFAAAVPGARRVPVRVRGPRGSAIDAAWLLLPDGTGVVELAGTSGIELLGDERRPWDADTFGFGQAIAAALAYGVRRLVLGIGSSASTDGGVGLLTALGAAFTDDAGAAVEPGARGVTRIARADLARLPALPRDGAVVLTDVTHPLLGAAGAAAVFGPQKGLTVDDVRLVDAALARLAALLPVDPALPGTGAAGGAGFALAAWGARLQPGAGAVAEVIALDEALAGAALVVTGEGSYDGQSAAGKVPSFVSARATAAGVPVALVAGRIAADADATRFTAAVSLTELAGGAAASLAHPARWLGAAGELLARDASARATLSGPR